MGIRHYFTFTQHDLEIIQQRRRNYNRLGFAVQLCVLRYLGFSHAMANGNSLHLIQLALEDLRKRKIILPSMATIERAVWETRKRTEEKIFKLLSISLTELQIAKLDRVITTMPESSKTYLAWLREIPGTSSPDSFLKVIEKLELHKGFATASRYERHPSEPATAAF